MQPCAIIPVLDLMQGQVVHAKHGNRDHYQAMQSPLCPTSEPLAMLSALQHHYAFQTLYIADLDAIQQRGHHLAVIEAIRQQFPHLTLWLDAGIRHSQQCQLFALPNTRLVVGSECISDITQFEHIRTTLADDYILSLDFKQQAFQGSDALLNQAHRWPKDIIVMTLSQVGSEAGPDFTTLHSIKTQAPKTSRIYAAGGVRNQADLNALATAGISGALVATALHQRNLDSRLGVQRLSTHK